MTAKLFGDLGLSRRLERAEAHANARFVEARARVSPEVQAEWIEVAGAYAMFDGVDSPLTQSFGLGLFDEIEADHMEALTAFFHNRGSPAYHETSPLALQRPPLLELLNGAGYIVPWNSRASCTWSSRELPPTPPAMSRSLRGRSRKRNVRLGSMSPSKAGVNIPN